MAGIYVHIPYCRKACTYCDFHFSTQLGGRAAMVRALAKEVVLQRRAFDGSLHISTLYFGGGTPSVLTQADWKSLLSVLYLEFDINPKAEVTVECNPDDLTPEYLEMLQGLGVNRLSIGVQSFREQDLKLMNRSHNAEQARQSIQWAQEAGFENLTVDLIYGIPGLSESDWQANLDQLFALKVPHISAYALTVEEKTALAHQVKKGQVEMPEDETYEAHFYQLINRLEAAGYEHYELSNFAQPGHRSRHNSAYWTGAPYWGIGPSAHSYHHPVRSWNVSNNAKYIKRIESGKLPIKERETLSAKDQINEYLMTQLRLAAGIDLKHLREKLGFDLEVERQEDIEMNLKMGWMEKAEGHLRLTRSGKLLSNSLISDLFAD